MTITEDSSQPNPPSTGTGTGALTTASFSPPANTLLVALVSGGWAQAATPISGTVTDSLSGTWTQGVVATGSSGYNGYAAVFYRYLSSAPGSMTVTATLTGNSGGRYLAVRVLNGASANQSGAGTGSNATQTATTTATVSLTTTKVGSWVYGVCNDPTHQSTTISPNSNTGVISTYSDTTDICVAFGLKASAATVTPGATVFGGTLSSADNPDVAFFEVLPAATSGNVTLSGSGTLGSSAVYAQQATATLSGSGTLSDSATLNQASSVALAGQGSLAATATVSSGFALLAGSGVLGALNPSVIEFSSAALAGAGTLSSALVLSQPGESALTGSGLLAVAAPAYFAEGIATLTGSGQLSVDNPADYTTIFATLTGQGSLAVSALMQAQPALALSGSGQLSSTGTRAVTPAVVLGGSGRLSEAALRSVLPTVVLSGSGVLLTRLTGRTVFPVVTLAAQGSLTVGATRQGQAAASLSGSGRLVLGVPYAASAVVARLVGSGQLTVAAVAARRTGIALTGSGKILVQGVVLSGAASLVGRGVLAASARANVTGTEVDAAASLTGSGVLGIQPTGGGPVAAVLSGSGQLLVVTLAKVFPGETALSGSGLLGVLAYIPVLPVPVPPQFPAAPFSVLHQPVVTTFLVGYAG